MTERMTPFHCPYCGEQELRPHEVVTELADGRREYDSPHGTWECRACLRAFALKALGVVSREVPR